MQVYLNLVNGIDDIDFKFWVQICKERKLGLVQLI